jgi:hypothetical protein
MAELIAIMKDVTSVHKDNVIARMLGFGEIKYILVSGKATLFQQCKTGELLRLEGEWVSDRIQIDFKALSCEKIYSEKVIDVLGD